MRNFLRSIKEWLLITPKGISIKIHKLLETEMSNLTPHFWQERFDTGETGWDRGVPSPQLLRWLDSGELTPCHIAVPGCGKGWEVVELARRGFDVTGLDYTEAAVREAQNNLQRADVSARIIKTDVLTYKPDQVFDAIYEQTCLCAIDPEHWIDYAGQLARWIKPGGNLYTLFMQVDRPGAKEGIKQGPPFHCDINAMHALFNSKNWQWPDHLPSSIPHPNGWHELAIRLTRKN